MSDPLTVPANDVGARLDAYIDTAIQRPIGITWDVETRVVMLSIEDYARLVRRDRQVIRVEDMENEMLEAILHAEPGKLKETGSGLA